MSDKDFGFGTQIRKSPYFDATVKWGATGFSVYNHMYIPRDFGSPEQNFWNLINDAILCDVAVERQVEITGPDAYQFIQLLTPRDLSKLAVGQCKYVLIVNYEGGIIKSDSVKQMQEHATVVLFVMQLGDLAYKDDARFPTGAWCKEGDFVITRAYAGTRIKIHGKEFRIINDDTVEAVVDDPRGYERA